MPPPNHPFAPPPRATGADAEATLARALELQADGRLAEADALLMALCEGPRLDDPLAVDVGDALLGLCVELGAPGAALTRLATLGARAQSAEARDDLRRAAVTAFERGDRLPEAAEAMAEAAAGFAHLEPPRLLAWVELGLDLPPELRPPAKAGWSDLLKRALAERGIEVPAAPVAEFWAAATAAVGALRRAARRAEQVLTALAAAEDDAARAALLAIYAAENPPAEAYAEAAVLVAALAGDGDDDEVDGSDGGDADADDEGDADEDPTL